MSEYKDKLHKRIMRKSAGSSHGSKIGAQFCYSISSLHFSKRSFTGLILSPFNLFQFCLRVLLQVNTCSALYRDISTEPTPLNPFN